MHKPEAETLQARASPKNFFRSQALFVSRHALLILLVMGLLTILAVPSARSLKLRANFMDLLPANRR